MLPLVANSTVLNDDIADIRFQHSAHYFNGLEWMSMCDLTAPLGSRMRHSFHS